MSCVLLLRQATSGCLLESNIALHFKNHTIMVAKRRFYPSFLSDTNSESILFCFVSFALRECNVSVAIVSKPESGPCSWISLEKD